MYEYMWGMTSAQIELLVFDVPIVVYNTEKKKFGKVSEKRINEVNEEWKKQYGGKEKGGKIDLSRFTKA